MQQFAYHPTVMPIDRRRYHRMDQLRLRVYAKMRFHPKINLIALARLVHYRVPALLAVPGRTRRFNDRCIDNRALLDLTSLFAQVAIDLLKDSRRQCFALQQVTELAYRGLVHHSLATQVDADKFAHHLYVIQRFFHRRVRKTIPMLQK